MMCQWKELLGILPQRLRREVDSLGRESLEELRLRINAPPELVFGRESKWLTVAVTREDLNFVVNAASRYSPWTASTVAQGYLTAPGGHRIGLCGEAVCRNGAFEGIREISSLCIRIARDFPGIGEQAEGVKGSLLILGAPGWGKTTLLRDLIRQRGEKEQVSVVDERGEIFPVGFARGRRVDVLSGCPKAEGILTVLRTMGPGTIGVDEITEERDCQALIQAAGCGVHLLATAHAYSVQDIRSRQIYGFLLKNRVFDTFLVLHKDKSYSVERVTL